MSEDYGEEICRGCKHTFREEELVDELCENCRIKEIRRQRR